MDNTFQKDPDDLLSSYPGASRPLWESQRPSSSHLTPQGVVGPVDLDHHRIPILGDPGAVSRVGRKGAKTVFKYKRKSPWVLTLTEPFPKILAPDWAQKKLCIIVPNRRTVSPEFFS